MNRFRRIFRPVQTFLLTGLFLILFSSPFISNALTHQITSHPESVPTCRACFSTPMHTKPGLVLSQSQTVAQTLLPPAYEITSTPVNPSRTSDLPTTPSPLPSSTGTLPSPREKPLPTPSPLPSPSTSPTQSPGSTATALPPAVPTPFATGSVLINEIAWAGTLASSYDEWLELYNPGSTSLKLDGWTLTDNGDINIALQGSIGPHGFFLLERTDDSTIADLSASQIYTGSLKNSGESLFLKDPSGAVVDRANASGGSWPGGNAALRASMERIHNQGEHWGTFTGEGSVGHDAAGQAIQGTPRHPNSVTSPTPSPTAQTPTPEATISPYPTQAVLINEVAWAGTLASAHDEWIELYNPGESPISLDGWVLTDDQNIHVTLSGSLQAHSFFLLERSDDSVISSQHAHKIYTGGLNNSGETLWLKDPSGKVIDSANASGGDWPAGNVDSRFSMERRGGADQPSNWGTFTGYNGCGLDAEGAAIPGTPLETNSILLPPPPPMWIKGKVVINEVLIRPHYDWEGKGGVDTGDEFIELLNLGPLPVFMKGWVLDDIPEDGSKPYVLPGITLQPGSFVALFRNQTKIALNDSGDTVRLLSSDGQLLDEVHYLKVRAYNLSYGRLPDGSGHLVYGLWPTPNKPNLLFEEQPPRSVHIPPICYPSQPRPRLLRPHIALSRCIQ